MSSDSSSESTSSSDSSSYTPHNASRKPKPSSSSESSSSPFNHKMRSVQNKPKASKPKGSAKTPEAAESQLPAAKAPRRSPKWRKRCGRHRKPILICGSCLLVTALLLTMIMVPLSYTYIEWNEFGFKKNTLDNEVDINEVFGPGRYHWGLTYSAVIFPSTYQAENLSVLVFTRAGIEVALDVAFQWRYTHELLPYAYGEFGLEVADAVLTFAESELKNVGPEFDTNQYFRERTRVAQRLYEALAETFLGSIKVELAKLQLLDVTFGQEQQERYLNAASQLQDNLREQFVQNHTLVRSETVSLQAQTRANITVTEAEAEADVQLVQEQARAEALLIETDARRVALRSLYDTLGFNTTERKLAYVYIAGLADRQQRGANTRILTDLGINELSLRK